MGLVCVGQLARTRSCVPIRWRNVRPLGPSICGSYWCRFHRSWNDRLLYSTYNEHLHLYVDIDASLGLSTDSP